MGAGLVAAALLGTCVVAGATEPTPQVQVRAAAPIAARKEANAAKTIIGRDELLRFGDSSVADVLRRVPGITVGGAQDIRLRGLGQGYTQILVNGEPVAEGFSLGALGPELIERIEVIRSATADMSAQAIAGSINIILRRAQAAPERAVKLHASTYDGLWSGGAVGQWSARSGAASYGVSSTLGVERNRMASVNQIDGRLDQGAAFSKRTDTIENNSQWKLDAAPRFGWQSGAQQLNVDGLLQAQHNRYRYDDVRSGVTGPAPDFMGDVLAIANDLTLLRATAQWKSPLAQHGKLDNKLSLSGNRRVSDALLTGAAADGTPILNRTIHSRLQDRALIVAGKAALRLGQRHGVSLGWDGQYGRRSENRIQRDRSDTGYPLHNLDEAYDASVSRLALYAQDELDWSPRLSGYLGLRWETLATRSEGRELARVARRFDVLSPTFQLLWKLPATRADQLRIALGRTYKAPTTKDLIPRRWVVMDNTATTPNFQGNPQLRPELSWGLDVAYEHYRGESGLASASVYARHVDHVLQQRVYQQDGVWIIAPYNHGQARIYGLELEAKMPARELWRAAPELDLRAGMTRNWSSVRALAGPGNRIGLQPPLTATLGADYRPRGTALTLGASWQFERGAFFRASAQDAARSNSKQRLDLVGVYQLAKGSQLRLTVSNALKPDEVVETAYADAGLQQQQVVREQSHCTLRLQWDRQL